VELPIKFWEDPEFINAITNEVRNQMQPVLRSITEIREQNSQQTNLLSSISKWAEELYGNGKGKKGFLERARDEDKQKLTELSAAVSEYKAEKLKQEGKAELLREQSETKINTLKKLRLWLGIIGTIAGAGLIDFIKPILLHWLQLPGK
jgi:hypothetical protein